ncbi:hypothetical protein HPB50_004586 [Hyalomma asiaticum]|uniref:Uncharacterized protein n=1 Tax=Hyalomma asiaticum TaxID=266040 RepID=A0ACB7TF80_HYAAI|nr:hypothetical protein HPB50_004586 [Hyalomma asiaticum]
MDRRREMRGIPRKQHRDRFKRNALGWPAAALFLPPGAADATPRRRLSRAVAIWVPRDLSPAPAFCTFTARRCLSRIRPASFLSPSSTIRNVSLSEARRAGVPRGIPGTPARPALEDQLRTNPALEDQAARVAYMYICFPVKLGPLTSDECTDEWYSIDTAQLKDEFLLRSFVQCELDAETQAFLDLSTEKSNWLGTQIFHAVARFFLGWFLTKTTLNGPVLVAPCKDACREPRRNVLLCRAAASARTSSRRTQAWLPLTRPIAALFAPSVQFRATRFLFSPPQNTRLGATFKAARGHSRPSASPE